MPYTGHGAGQYNNRVTIEQNLGTADGAGQLVPNWQAFCKRWAMIAPRGGMEKKVFEQLRPEIDHLVRIRSDSQTQQILPVSFRVNWGGKILNIGSVVDVDSRRIELEMHCVEVQKLAGS